MVQYTGASGSCPDPSLYLVQMYQDLAREIQSFVCSQVGLVSTETQAQLDLLGTQVSALTNSTDLIDRITALQTFLNSLDVNNDGQLDAVVALQQIADNAAAAAAAAQTSADAGRALAEQVSGQLNAFQTQVLASLTAISTTAQTALTQATTTATDLAALQAQVAALPPVVGGVSQEQFDALQTTVSLNGNQLEYCITRDQLDAAICAEHFRVFSAMDAARAAMAAVFAEGCPAPAAGAGYGSNAPQAE